MISRFHIISTFIIFSVNELSCGLADGEGRHYDAKLKQVFMKYAVVATNSSLRSFGLLTSERVAILLCDGCESSLDFHLNIGTTKKFPDQPNITDLAFYAPDVLTFATNNSGVIKEINLFKLHLTRSVPRSPSIEYVWTPDPQKPISYGRIFGLTEGCGPQVSQPFNSLIDKSTVSVKIRFSKNKCPWTKQSFLVQDSKSVIILGFTSDVIRSSDGVYTYYFGIIDPSYWWAVDHDGRVNKKLPHITPNHVLYGGEVIKPD